MDVILLSLVATGICWCLHPQLKNIAGLHPLPGLLLLTALLIALHHLGALRVEHYKSRRWRQYPPAVLAAGLAAMWLCILFPEHAATAAWLTGVILLVSAAVLAYLVLWLGGRIDSKEKAPKKTTTEKKREFDLIKWIMSDDPINDPAGDCFSIEHKVDKLVTELKKMRKEKGNIAMTGEWGVGKSTVIEMAKTKLDENEFITCTVGAWGFRNEAVVSAVLKKAVAEVTEHADGLAIQTMPSHYIAAAKDVSPGWLKGVFTLLSIRDPQQQLERLDRVLRTIDAHLVVFIEDLDRNVKGSEEIFLDIEALLNRVSHLQSITFVLTVTGSGKQHTIDLDRLFTHRIDLLNIPRDRTMEMIQTLLHHCVDYSAKKGDVCLKTPDDYRIMAESEKDAPLAMWNEANDIPSTHALCQLLNTPRLLKHALRKTWLAWQALHGEIDIEDLLVLQAISVLNTEALVFIRDHYSDLSRMAGHHDREMAEQLREQFHREMPSLAEQEWERESYIDLIGFLFPGLENRSEIPESDNPDIERHLRAERRQRPAPNDGKRQHVRDECHFFRAFDSYIYRYAVRDQKVVHDVSLWKANAEQSQLVKRICENSEYMTAFLHLYEVPTLSPVDLDGPEVLKLTSHIFAQVRQTKPNNATEKSILSGKKLLYMIREGRTFNDYEDWLLKELKEALPVSLGLVGALEANWLSRRVATAEDSKEFKQKWDVCKLEWCDANLNGKKLCGILPDYTMAPENTNPLVYLFPRQTPVEFQVYGPWLPRVLLEALVEDPDRLIPLVTALLIDRRPFENVLHRSLTRNIFQDPNDLDALLEHMNQKVDESNWPESTQRLIAELRKQLLEWKAEGFVSPPKQ